MNIGRIRFPSEENQMKNKIQRHRIAIELILAAILLLFLLALAASRLQYRDLGSGGGFENFYSLKKDSLDYMVFGSSHAGCTVDDVKIWNDFGYAGYTLSAGSQPIEETYWFIKEALRTQHPKVIFVETLLVNGNKRGENGKFEKDLASIYRCDLGMKWSLSYCRMVMEQSSMYGLSFDETANLLLKLPITHARYAELAESDYINPLPYNVGYYGSYDTGAFDAPELTEERGEVDTESLEYLRKIKNLCDAEGVHVLFFHAPYPETTDECAVQNTISDFLGSIGSDYVDFIRIADEIGLDYQTDMRSDGSHLNNSGADKVTAWLETYMENYGLNDHRGDNVYSRWDKSSRWMQARANQNALSQAATIDTFLTALGEMTSDYDILVTFSGNYNVGTLDPSWFASVGLTPDDFAQGGSYLIRNSSIVYSSAPEETYCDSLQSSSTPITFLRRQPASEATADADGGYEGRNINDGLYIGTDNYALTVNGINIVIYDPALKLVIDNIGVNVYNGTDVLREADLTADCESQGLFSLVR